jgi:hypothetical protein
MHLIKYIQKYKTPTCFDIEVPKHVGDSCFIILLNVFY